MKQASLTVKLNDGTWIRLPDQKFSDGKLRVDKVIDLKDFKKIADDDGKVRVTVIVD